MYVYPPSALWFRDLDSPEYYQAKISAGVWNKRDRKSESRLPAFQERQPLQKFVLREEKAQLQRTKKQKK